MMRKIFLQFAAFLLITINAYSKPSIGFEELLMQSENNPRLVLAARNLAAGKNIPVNILTLNKVMYDVKGIENGKVVYAVFKNLADVYNGGYCAFYEDVVKETDFSKCRLDYGNGNITDNTGGMYNPVISNRSGLPVYLMIPDWTYDRVYLFNWSNGNLIDTAFIMHSNPQLQSPKHALQHFNKVNILVADQISDLVQKFDTAGFYITYYAPSTGVNTSIIDNMRGIRFRANNNLLATVASGASQNTIQEFDTAGNHIGTFINSNLNSPFDILLRENDMLITNSSGTNRITKYDLNGNYISPFYSGTGFAFPQQMYRLSNGNIVVAAFSTPSGLMILDSAGNHIRSFTSVTGLRSAYLLGNGNYMTTNATGVHELDSANGTLLRTIVTGANYQYVSEYIPDMVVNINNYNSNPGSYNLYQNYPNPFNPETILEYEIGNSGFVSLNIYDALGKEVASFVNQIKPAGRYSVNYDGTNLQSGVYFYSLLIDGNTVDTKRMLLIK